MPKPKVVVFPVSADSGFEWMSIGWYDAEQRYTPEGQALMARTQACIAEGKDRSTVIKLLEDAGFDVQLAD